MVIIDTPPMLQMPDARVLGKLADGVILVVRSARTTKETAAAAGQRLAEDGTRVLGTVLNEWDPRKAASAGLRLHLHPITTNRNCGAGGPRGRPPANRYLPVPGPIIKSAFIGVHPAANSSLGVG